MAPLPVINNTHRVTIDFLTVSGVTPRCIHHVRGTSSDGAEAAEAVDSALQTGQFGPMLAGHQPTTISVISLDGAQATVVHTLTTTADLCLGTGQMMPQVAALVSLRTTTRGPRGRGRQYVGPIVEQAQLDGQMDPATRANLETAWEDYQEALQALDPVWELVIASYAHAEANSVSSITVDPITATQRRRQDQLR